MRIFFLSLGLLLLGACGSSSSTRYFSKIEDVCPFLLASYQDSLLNPVANALMQRSDLIQVMRQEPQLQLADMQSLEIRTEEDYLDLLLLGVAKLKENKIGDWKSIEAQSCEEIGKQEVGAYSIHQLKISFTQAKNLYHQEVILLRDGKGFRIVNIIPYLVKEPLK